MPVKNRERLCADSGPPKARTDSERAEDAAKKEKKESTSSSGNGSSESQSQPKPEQKAEAKPESKPEGHLLPWDSDNRD